MNLIDFLRRFPTEQACMRHFRSLKEKHIIVCDRCGNTSHYWLENKLMHECKTCRRRISLRSGTSLAHTKLPFQYWYLTLHLMTATKKSFSALEMRRQLGHKRYEPIFRMMHKIRLSMGNRDDAYRLTDMIEIDDAYIETCTDSADKQRLRRGKGSQRQTKTTVMVESVLLDDMLSGKTVRQCRYFKMKVNPSERADDMQTLVKSCVSSDAVVFSDNSKAYVNLHKVVGNHLIENSKTTIETQSLKWVHIAISNVKRTLLGIYHSVNESYLQRYLDEFCYKLNRRYFGTNLFDRGILAVMAL
jgi:ISXO2-like transposase domain